MKNDFLILGLLLFTTFGLQCIAPKKGKHLVQDHITTLKTQLESKKITSEQRRRLGSYLRAYFDDELYGQHRKLISLDSDTKAIADSITKSFQDILKTPGSHKQAAEHYALEVGGLIAYHINTNKKTKHAKKTGVTPSRASEKSEAKETKSKGWLQEAESVLFGKKSEQPTETKPAVTQQAAKTTAGTKPVVTSAAKTTTKPTIKPVEKTQVAQEKTLKAKKETKHKKTETGKKKTHKSKAEKEAKKAKKKERKKAKKIVTE